VSYHAIIRHGRGFDGSGGPSAVRHVGIRDGQVVAITPHELDATDCLLTIDAAGKWVMPGMLDIHTHHDVEVLNDPSLSESLRHGVTTVLLGSCSLSTAHVDGVDAGDAPRSPDAGAHLRNMAFYNMGLRLLRHVKDADQAGEPFMTIEQAVHRLTGELADWYRIDGGHLRIGDRADLVIVDPARLDASLDDYAEDRVEQYGGLARMVNRNDDTVTAVFVAGRAVFLNGKATDLVGTRRTGRFLRAAHKAPAVRSNEGELVSVS
jgi:N-acyl-D-aspartate/D-glutamate deacylase